MPWRALLIVVLIAVMLASYSVLKHRAEPEPLEQPVNAQAGYYLHNALVTEIDAAGVPRLKLHADAITQTLRDDSIALQTVTLNYQSAADTKWLLTANEGHLPAGSRTVEFAGAVYIRPVEQRDNHIELHTEALSVDTDKNIATAPGRVKLVMDQQHLTATGLKYDLKRQTLQLKSELHGQFQTH